MHSTDMQKERFVAENIKAEEAIAADKLPEAAGILVAIVGKDPENYRAFNNMGIISWSQKSWHDAYAMFLKSVTIQPDYADALVNLFDAAIKLEKVNEILPAFETACELNPHQEEITILRDSIRDLGNDVYKSKRAMAIGIYNPLLEEAKNELDSGNHHKAMELFLKVNDTQGPNALALCGLGILSYYHERFNDAFVLFLESIKLNPLDTETFMNLLDAAVACNRVEDAKTIFTTFHKEFPELEKIKSYFEK